MILVDYDMLCHRCYRAMDHLHNSKNEPTGMEYGVFRVLKTLGKRITDFVADPNKHEVILCFEGGRGFESLKPAWYKANREHPPDSFYHRKSRLAAALREVYSNAELEGYEADQTMFSLSLGNHIAYIYSNDSDLFQAISSTTTVVRSFENNLYFWDEADILDKFLVKPWQFAFYKTLIGDKTDNIPGIFRIRRKLAAEIARKTWFHYIAILHQDPEMALIDCLKEYQVKVSSIISERFASFIENQLSINLHLIQLRSDLEVQWNRPRRGSIQSYLDKLEIKSLTFEDETEF